LCAPAAATTATAAMLRSAEQPRGGGSPIDDVGEPVVMKKKAKKKKRTGDAAAEDLGERVGAASGSAAGTTAGKKKQRLLSALSVAPSAATNDWAPEGAGGTGPAGGGRAGAAGGNAMLAQRQELPIFKAEKEILAAVSKHDTLVLVGETGSGKTTQLPQFLHAAGYSKRGMIAITQPRRVAATSVAARVAQEMSCRLGGQVGYAVRFDDCTCDETKIKFMTDGAAKEP
jgi:hypothetical protein